MAKGMKTGGRQPGTPNRDKIPAQLLAEKLGVDPLEVLLNFVKGDWAALGYKSPHEAKMTSEMRLKAAGEVSQYIYPKRKAVEMTGEVEAAGITIKIVDYQAKKE